MMVTAFAKTLNLLVEPKGKSIDTWACKLFYKMGITWPCRLLFTSTSGPDVFLFNSIRHYVVFKSFLSTSTSGFVANLFTFTRDRIVLLFYSLLHLALLSFLYTLLHVSLSLFYSLLHLTRSSFLFTSTR
jgi:hypothetical protein